MSSCCAPSTLLQRFFSAPNVSFRTSRHARTTSNRRTRTRTGTRTRTRTRRRRSSLEIPLLAFWRHLARPDQTAATFAMQMGYLALLTPASFPAAGCSHWLQRRAGTPQRRSGCRKGAARPAESPSFGYFYKDETPEIACIASACRI